MSRAPAASAFLVPTRWAPAFSLHAASCDQCLQVGGLTGRNLESSCTPSQQNPVRHWIRCEIPPTATVRRQGLSPRRPSLLQSTSVPPVKSVDLGREFRCPDPSRACTAADRGCHTAKKSASRAMRPPHHREAGVASVAPSGDWLANRMSGLGPLLARKVVSIRRHARISPGSVTIEAGFCLSQQAARGRMHAALNTQDRVLQTVRYTAKTERPEWPSWAAQYGDRLVAAMSSVRFVNGRLPSLCNLLITFRLLSLIWRSNAIEERKFRSEADQSLSRRCVRPRGPQPRDANGAKTRFALRQPFALPACAVPVARGTPGAPLSELAARNSMCILGYDIQPAAFGIEDDGVPVANMRAAFPVQRSSNVHRCRDDDLRSPHRLGQT